MLPTLLPKVVAAAAAAAALAALPTATASADSIVYAKQGNLFLTSPDGAKGYQLTFDGGYSSPSQADDGTIGALRNKQLVRLDRRGRMLNDPINGMGSPGPGSSRNIGGPYEPRISPDGKRFAYYFYVQTSFDDYENDIRWIDTGSYSTWTWADHFTSPATESEYQRSLTQAEWVANDRLLGTMGFWMNMWTWVTGTGHGYTSSAAQWWFGLQDPPDEWGVAAYHWYEDPALTRDGTKLAMTDGDGDASRLLLAATHGPAWSGTAPYPEPDYVNGTNDLAAPTIACDTAHGKVLNPTWSADGGTLAYGAGDGVHVLSVPANLDCGHLADRLLVPGGEDPAFGPADVDPALAPAPATPAATTAPAPGAGARTGATAPVLSKLALEPQAFRPGRGTTIRYTLTTPARVTLTVTTGRGRTLKGKIMANGRAGTNTMRFSGRLHRRALRRGSYVLVLSAKGTVARTAFRIR
jgi:hypothetical protein